MQKFAEILTKEDLIDYFEGKKFDKVNLEIGDYEDKENFNKYFIRLEDLKAEFNQDLRELTDKKTIVKTDAIFSKKIFNQLQIFPRRELTDIRFWQWLGLDYLQNYIWFRWGKLNLPLKNDEKIHFCISKLLFCY